MKRRRVAPGSRRGAEASEPDLETQLREAFTAEDPEAAWYLDRVLERIVRVAHGATDIPDLTADEVEEDDGRYAEVPAVAESRMHAWMEEFVEERAAIANLLDERHGANARFLTRLAATDAAAFAEWKSFHAARVAEVIAAWRAGLG